MTAMTWTAMVGKSPRQAPGDVVTTVTFTSDSAKGFTQDVQNDGSVASLTAASKAVAGKLDSATAAVQVVTPGTVLDLTDPVPPQQPPPTPLQIWQTARRVSQQCQRGLEEQIPGFDQARLTSAIGARDALYDKAFESSV